MVLKPGGCCTVAWGHVCGRRAGKGSLALGAVEWEGVFTLMGLWLTVALGSVGPWGKNTSLALNALKAWANIKCWFLWMSVGVNIAQEFIMKCMFEYWRLWGKGVGSKVDQTNIHAWATIGRYRPFFKREPCSVWILQHLLQSHVGLVWLLLQHISYIAHKLQSRKVLCGFLNLSMKYVHENKVYNKQK